MDRCILSILFHAVFGSRPGGGLERSSYSIDHLCDRVRATASGV